MKLFLAILFVFFPLISMSQRIELTDDFQQKKLLFELNYYIDSTQKADFEQIKNVKFDSTVKRQNYGFVNFPFWVRIKFDNANTKKRFFLEIENVDSLEFWQKNSKHQWERILTGETLPFDTRPILHRAFLFSISLVDSSENTIYLCYRNQTQIRLHLRCWEEDFFHEQNTKNIFFYGFFYGIIILMIVYNFSIWLAIREISYLYYVGFALFLFITQFSMYGFAYQYWFGNMPFFNQSGFYIWVGLTNICSANFARLFLDARRYSTFVEKLLFFMSFYGVLVIILANFLSFSAISRFVLTFNPLYILMLIGSAIAIWRKGNQYARYFVFAWLAYIAGIVLMSSHNRNLLETSFLTDHALQLATIIEIVMLSLAMSYKYKKLNEEAQQNHLKMQALEYEQQRKEEEKKYLQETMRQKDEIYLLEQEKMQEILAFKERELTTMMIQVAQKNKMMSTIQKKLEKINENGNNSSENIKILGKSLQNNINLDGDWENFKLHFENVHPNFFGRLQEKYPNFTSNDLKFSAYLRICLGTKEIARLLNIDPKSVKMTKYRLKKKLNLSEEQDLETFIRQF
ncbi:MAG: hypothetical protein EAZ97_04845 [Bacteroidetes bacterium]|nr:MAG: hypothetical protein EAZ97_04845 [Bacteroidota bacterium]